MGSRLPRAHRRPGSPGGVCAGRRRVWWGPCPGSLGGRGVRVPPPLPRASPREVTNLPLRFLPVPRPGPSVRPSLLPSQAPTDGQADARTKGPADGRPARSGAARRAGERPDLARRPHPLGAGAADGGSPGLGFPRWRHDAGLRLGLQAGLGRAGHWREGPRRARGLSLGWRPGAGPAAWPAPSGPGAAP